MSIHCLNVGCDSQRMGGVVVAKKEKDYRTSRRGHQRVTRYKVILIDEQVLVPRRHPVNVNEALEKMQKRKIFLMFPENFGNLKLFREL